MARPDAADVARMRRIIARLISYGVEVREMPGHETRGFAFPGADPSRVVDHHDASSLKSGEWGALGLCLDGTPRGIPGPLCNVLVARCLDGRPRVAIVADGYAYHAGTGGPYAELPKDNANPHTYGVEKANDGLGEPYTAAANYATNALFHAMAVESGAIPESYPIGHKEWAPGRKSDPLYSMADRRRQVASFSPTFQEEDLTPEQDRKLNAVYDAIFFGGPSTPRGESLLAIADGIPSRVWLSPVKRPDAEGVLRDIPAIQELADAKTAALALAGQTTSPGSTPALAIDYSRLAKEIVAEQDRVARDGNPATGPVS